MRTIFIPDTRKSNTYQTNLSNSLERLGVSVSYKCSIRSFLKKWPDILHIHWTYPFMVSDSLIMTILKSTKFIFSLLILRILGIKIIWTVHNISDHERKHQRTELFFNRLLSKLSNRLIVHCPSIRKEVSKTFSKDEDSIFIIQHGNYIDQYDNNITSSDARKILELGNDDKVFLYFGQLRPYKGIDELISSFKKLKSESAKLLIAGKPLNYDMGAKILNDCSSDARIQNVLKFIPDDDIQIYMNAADVVVLPYKEILTSGAVILSMSFGKTIIAPSVNCIADNLDEKTNFLYYRNGSIIEQMNRALNTDRSVLKDMGEYNLKIIEQFSWEKIAEMTKKLYIDVRGIRSGKKFT